MDLSITYPFRTVTYPEAGMVISVSLFGETCQQ